MAHTAVLFPRNVKHDSKRAALGAYGERWIAIHDVVACWNIFTKRLPLNDLNGCQSVGPLSICNSGAVASNLLLLNSWIASFLFHTQLVVTIQVCCCLPCQRVHNTHAICFSLRWSCAGMCRHWDTISEIRKGKYMSMYSLLCKNTYFATVCPSGCIFLPACWNLTTAWQHTVPEFFL